jgi:synaptobrevin family protein YKT6|tara:strand:+ start:137 stop:763 length:627 start_codon:yes stop_codon:yes gene_type:complete
MKIFAISICRPNTEGTSQGETKEDEPIIISQVFDVAEFNFFQRSSVRQFLTAFTRIFVKRTTPGKRLAVEHEGHVVHTWTLTNNLSGCVICDKEYPSRVAFSLVRKMLDEFMKEHTDTDWAVMKENAVQFTPLSEAIVSYQDPKNVDKLTKIQQELNETTEIMHQTIDKVLERGVKLDDLVDRSADLSNQSRMFYKTAKKHNSCCVIS